MKSKRGSFGLVLLAALSLPVDLDGQSGEVGVAANLIIDYPSDGAEEYCDQQSGGVTVHSTFWPLRGLGAEVSIGATGGLDGQRCVFDQVPRPVGVPFTRNRYADGDFGSGTLASTLALVVEPWRGASVSPRGKAGGGVMLDKGLAFWLLSGGIRYGFGRHALTMDVEWWNVSIGVVTETVVLPPSGPLEVLSSQRFDSTYGMFNVRVGWAMELF